jgi:small nuclear ribonucleoprotein (snRNP)-like protein
MEYVGTLQSADAYMNVQLTNTDEYIGYNDNDDNDNENDSSESPSQQQFAGHLGEVLIRCNNILYIVAAPPKFQPNSATTTTTTPAANVETMNTGD